MRVKIEQLLSGSSSCSSACQHGLGACRLVSSDTRSLEGSTETKAAGVKRPWSSSASLHTLACWCVSLPSASPQTLYKCKPSQRSSRTSGWTDGCWFGRSGLVFGQECWWRSHCSLQRYQATSSPLPEVQRVWTDRPEWLGWTGAQHCPEGRLSGQEEPGRGLNTQEEQSHTLAESSTGKMTWGVWMKTSQTHWGNKTFGLHQQHVENLPDSGVTAFHHHFQGKQHQWKSWWKW